MKLTTRGKSWRIAAAATIMLLAGLPSFAQDASSETPPVAAPANAPAQIKKAQVELKRLDCLAGRVDGKLNDRTRTALKKFWASAKRPPLTDIAITDELIADLADHGDNYCRPPRKVFFSGGGHGGNPAMLPFFAPGGRPPLPATPPAVNPPATEPQ